MSADYGTDLSLAFDLDPMGAMVSGRQLLSEALVRRITTPRGRLLSDPNYGYDVTDELNDDLGAADVSQIATNMDAEMIKDERVISSSTVVTQLPDGSLNTVTTIVDGAGPFPLTLSVSAVTVTILQTGTAR